MLSRSGFRCFAACLPFLLLAACGGKEPQAKANGNAAERPIPVTTRVVRPSAWNDTLQALGTAKARESVTLTAKVSEIVQDVHFESGQQVRAGQVLVTLKGDAAQAALVQAEATYAEAERLYRRQKELADQQLIARSQLDTQLALRDAAAARVRQARADIADRSVRAPFAGVLGIRQVSPGSLITANSTIATLDDVSACTWISRCRKRPSPRSPSATPSPPRRPPTRARPSRVESRRSTRASTLPPAR